MTDASKTAEATTEDRGFTKLEFQLNDYPGPVKTVLFGIQHVLVMFTAMVGGPLIVARLLDLPAETRIDMITGTMIGCGVGTMISALGVGRWALGSSAHGCPSSWACFTSLSARWSRSARQPVSRPQ